MKLIDFAIVFSIVLVCFITVDKVNNDMIMDNANRNIMYNKSMDRIVMDTLLVASGIENEDVKLSIIKNYFMNELSILLKNTSVYKEMLGEYCTLLYKNDDCFYVYNKGKWSDPYKNENISRALSSDYNINVFIPEDDTYSYINKVEGESLLAIYKNKNVNIFSLDYYVYTFSGAALREHATYSTTNSENDYRKYMN